MKLFRAFGVFAVASAVVMVSANSVALSAPTDVPWHLDRVNQRALPLDGNTDRGVLTGAGIDIYIVDTGVRATHEQFGGRVVAGVDYPTSTGASPVTPATSDCDGHGTHVSGLTAGATTGVAPQARIISVRVLDCNGDGEVENVAAALKWVRAHHRSGQPAIVNLSLGVDFGDDGRVIDAEVLALIKEGVVVTVAAGNGDSSGRPFDACQISPGDVARALTVGAVTTTDAMASYSNYGSCIDLFAPGGDRSTPLISSWIRSDSDYAPDVGTSMASPLVAGFAALLAQQQPGLCADDISHAIVSRATQGVITGLDAVSPNRLLFIDTSLVPAGRPGQASHVIVTSDGPSIVASWDAPCDGGSPITGTTASLLLSGRVIKRAQLAPGVNAVRFTGLRLGVKYQVVVKAKNDVGAGVATPRITSVPLRTLRKGQTVRTTSIGSMYGMTLKWNASQTSSKVCAIKSNPTRLVALRVGTCRVGLRAIDGQRAVIRTFQIRS